jgi:Bacterial Ig-like domain (group 3)
MLNTFSTTTKIKLTSSPNPSHVNQSVTLTATVSASVSVPNGSVITFYNGATEIGSATTTNGVASFATSFSTAGKYTIQAAYAGDAYHTASSRTATHFVNP